MILQVEGGLTRHFNLIRGKNRSTTEAARALMIHVRTSLCGNAGEALPVGPPPEGGLRPEVGLRPESASAAG